LYSAASKLGDEAHARKSSMVMVMIVVPFLFDLMNKQGSDLVCVKPFERRYVRAPSQNVLPPCRVPYKFLSRRPVGSGCLKVPSKRGCWRMNTGLLWLKSSCK